ncbi:two-component response regulator 24 [Quercus suber]|uniref:Two-component response regulator 24 n=1 Tax=Quercus suber TaxID=58331 RepID=A0AAW0KRI2_QUESU|nr:two-component response regulator ORR42-like [Quercus suber]XP_023877966.1 two-component response regulator ORR42-like [Quercus suber]POE78958.1 two-component response regulator orr42 [Quercus suber]
MGAAVDHVSPMGMSGGSAEGNDKSDGQRFSCKNKLTALVVDNGGACQAVQTALLRSYGVETEAVETGEAAVELIASGATFSLIIIEMFLPLMNGPETAKQIRAMGAQSKILGITAFFDERDQQEFLAAGADKYIEKPLSQEIVIPIIRELDS